MSVIARPIALMMEVSEEGGQFHNLCSLHIPKEGRTELARGMLLTLSTALDRVVAVVELDDGSIEIWPANQCKFVKSLKERMDDR